MNQPFKVLITTSGVGARLGEITKYTNKSLVRIGNKPVISYIIEKYPEDTRYVITIGYFGDQVRDFLELAYPNRSFEFVTIDKYEGEGSSLLYSLSQAKKKLQEPFIFHACDTITFSDIPPPAGNWIAGFKGLGSSNYASFSTLGKKVTEMHFKGYINSDFLHVGLLGIHEFEIFWSKVDEILALRADDSTIGDVDVLKDLVHTQDFRALELGSWLDMGNVDSLEIARKAINDDAFHILDKLAESIYKVDGSIIKFFHDPEILNDRVQRVKYLGGTVPALTGVKENFYKYSYVEGDLFANVANRGNFLSLISWAEENLWTPIKSYDELKFKRDCTDFYVTKTNKRLQHFFEKKGVRDTEDIINQEHIPKVSEMLKQIDTDSFCSDVQTGFHGDFILDNIIMLKKGEFKLIDWRQNFAGNLEGGDKYYDLAKLAHNLVVNHELIDKNHFQIDINPDGSIDLNIHRLQTLVECENVYFNYIRKAGLSLKKVLLLRSIIWLNMSPLHHHPFDLFLYYFGKYELAKVINQGKMKYKNFILDVDGVFTDGKFHYTSEGKSLKTFGDADNDALSLIKDHLHIEMISGDKRGYGITKRRIQDDMGYQLSQVSTFQRKAWLEERFDLNETIYMGDGIYDILVFEVIGFSIAPANAFPNTKKAANFVTEARGGEGAVAEACLYIMEKFLHIDFNTLVRSQIKESGAWGYDKPTP